MEPPLNINVSMADVGNVIAVNNEFKLALENEALKRMVREMQANAKEAEEESEEGSEDEAQGQAAD